MITEYLILGAIVFLLAVEVWAGIDPGPNSPWITTVVRKYAKKYPILPFAAGVLVGHFFWCS